MPEELQDEKIDITGLNDVLLYLQQAFNTKKKADAEKANDLLSRLLQSGSTEKILPVRADELVIPDNHGFISSGSSWLDTCLGGGLRKEEMVVLGLPPGTGKTHLLTFLSTQFIKQGLTCFHFNGEDILSDVDDTYSKGLKQEDQQKLWYIDIRNRFTVGAIDAILSESKVKPDFIVVDHLDCMDNEGSGQDWLEAGNTATKLRRLCKKYNVFCLTASQIDFGNSGNTGMQRLHRGKVSKASPGDVFWIADAIVETDYYFSVGKSKGRNQRIRKFVLHLNFETMEGRVQL